MFEFYKETEFKESEIGRIPREWGIMELKLITDIIMGQSPPSNTYNLKQIGLPFLQGSAEFGSIYPYPKMYCSNPMKIVNSENILISVRAPVGDINISNDKICIGRGLAGLVPLKINIFFLFYYLMFCKTKLEQLAGGSTFKSINRDVLENFKLPDVKKEEQQTIAQILTAIDNAIDVVSKQIETLNKIKKATMEKLLTKGIGHKEFKDSEIGRIPREWGIVKIGEVCDFIVPGRDKPKIFDGEIPWITISDLCERNIFKSQKGLYISKKEMKSCGNHLIPINSVIMSCVGEFGIVSIAKKEIIINQQLHAFIPPKDIDSSFLRYALINQKKYMERIASKTTILYMNKFKCNSIPILKPNFKEQKEIVKILEIIEDTIDLKHQKKQTLKRIKKKVMDILLTGEIRIKLIEKEV